MIKNKLLVILADREISLKQIADKVGVRYATLWSFAKNKTQSADYALLNTLCKELDVKPGDIIKYIPDNE